MDSHNIHLWFIHKLNPILIIDSDYGLVKLNISYSIIQMIKILVLKFISIPIEIRIKCEFVIHQ
jgi:hypothetical protein